MADLTGSLVGVGLGRPKAPPKGVGCAPAGTLDPNGAVLEVEVGRDEECVGLDGASDDLRYDSVRSEISEVSSLVFSKVWNDLYTERLTLPEISIPILSFVSCWMPLTPLEYTILNLIGLPDGQV